MVGIGGKSQRGLFVELTLAFGDPALDEDKTTTKQTKVTTTRYWLSLSNFEVNLALRSEKEFILVGGYPKIFSKIPINAT